MFQWGSYDRADICELVGKFILDESSEKYNNRDISL